MLSIIIKSISSIFVSYFFGVMFNVRGKKIILAAIAGGVTWFIYDFTVYLGQSETIAYFISAICLTVYAEVVARLSKATVTTFLIVGLIPTVPGGGIYYTLFHLLNKNTAKATEVGLKTLMLTGALAFGILFVSSIYSTYSKIKDIKLKQNK
ncbi:MAG: threonine/serine exporter family protein [Fusobacteriaceae bacterium]